MNISDNVFCEFVTNDNIHFECINCGVKVTANEPQESAPFILCSKPLTREKDENITTFAQKIKNFAKAATQHIKEGMPMCTEEQIIKRHDICLRCEFFKDDTCSKCGCPLIRSKQFVSKLAWADQECPAGKWGKEI